MTKSIDCLAYPDRRFHCQGSRQHSDSQSLRHCSGRLLPSGSYDFQGCTHCHQYTETSWTGLVSIHDDKNSWIHHCSYCIAGWHGNRVWRHVDIHRHHYTVYHFRCNHGYIDTDMTHMCFHKQPWQSSGGWIVCTHSGLVKERRPGKVWAQTFSKLCKSTIIRTGVNPNSKLQFTTILCNNRRICRTKFSLLSPTKIEFGYE